MDRSFLSQPAVVAASRRFVCIRPLTYEDSDAHEFMRKLLVGRSGEVENTTCCLLSPDGRRPLTRPSRGFQQVYRDGPQMAEWMEFVADQCATDRVTARQPEVPIRTLPRISTVRLALATAAADNVPLAILYAPNRADRARGLQQLAKLAWHADNIGRYAFAVVESEKELRAISPAKPSPGLLLIQPDRFGLKGSLLAHTPVTSGGSRLAAALRDGLKRFRPRTTSGFEHIRAGQIEGAFWETALPVTDPQEAAARARHRPSAGGAVSPPAP